MTDTPTDDLRARLPVPAWVIKALNSADAILNESGYAHTDLRAARDYLAGNALARTPADAAPCESCNGSKWIPFTHEGREVGKRACPQCVDYDELKRACEEAAKKQHQVYAGPIPPLLFFDPDAAVGAQGDGWAMTDAEIEQWIGACNYGKARDTLRHYLRLRAAPAAGRGDGISLIAAERQRQIAIEGWTPEHDDEHAEGELAVAAACYAAPERSQSDWETGTRPRKAILALWPWALSWWKPTPKDRIRELAKAGALIAAEIDRLRRAAPAGTAASDAGGTP